MLRLTTTAILAARVGLKRMVVERAVTQRECDLIVTPGENVPRQRRIDRVAIDDKIVDPDQDGDYIGIAMRLEHAVDLLFGQQRHPPSAVGIMGHIRLYAHFG